MNVGTSPVPFHDLSIMISNRHRPGAEPAIVSIFPAQAIFRFVVSPRLNGLHPSHFAALRVVRMHIVQPTDTVRGGWSPSVFIKPVAYVVVVPISLTAADDIRSGADNSVELLVPSRQLHVEAQQDRK